MPEGDTIHRTAASLQRVLEGRSLAGFDAPRLPPPLPAVGTIVERIEARGKHLLIFFGDGLVLHTHLRMTGSWHLYRPDARWAKPRRQARVVVRTEGAVAVCFNAPVVEVIDATSLDRHPTLRRLGPDLCRSDPDLDAAVQRMATLPEPNAAVADVLLDQRVASGIGNVYKSETLFLHGVDPTTPVKEVDEPLRRSLLSTASELLRANLEGARRTTVRGAPPGTLWVYGRAGRPCRRCGAAIVAAHQGDQARITFWCPSCQGPGVRLGA